MTPNGLIYLGLLVIVAANVWTVVLTLQTHHRGQARFEKYRERMTDYDKRTTAFEVLSDLEMRFKIMDGPQTALAAVATVKHLLLEEQLALATTYCTEAEAEIKAAQS